MIALFFFFALAFASDVVVLDESNFDTIVNGDKHVFVEFFGERKRFFVVVIYCFFFFLFFFFVSSFSCFLFALDFCVLFSLFFSIFQLRGADIARGLFLF